MDPTAPDAPLPNAPDPTGEADPRFLFRWDDLPAATPDLPGTGGTIRIEPEDFEVVELPAYEPAGEGSHLYAYVRKTGLTTRDLVSTLQAAGVPEKAIGVAGLKDKRARTEQWLSVPNARADAIRALEELEGVEVLRTSRHRNKLGIGHLRGNRFRIRVRDVPGADGEGEGAEAEGPVARARAILEALAERGLPNYYGPQRFGRFGSNAWDGLRLARGERVPGGHRLQRFFLSALQSLAVNALLAERLERGLYRAVLEGDWARKHDTGGIFRVEDAAAESPRAERLEISTTFPLYGKKIKPTTGPAGELEAEVLARFGLRWTDFVGRRGDRRAGRVALEGASVEPAPGGYVLTFDLPKGSYATSLLREVLKVPVDAPIDGGADEGGADDEASQAEG